MWYNSIIEYGRTLRQVSWFFENWSWAESKQRLIYIHSKISNWNTTNQTPKTWAQSSELLLRTISNISEDNNELFIIIIIYYNSLIIRIGEHQHFESCSPRPLGLWWSINDRADGSRARTNVPMRFTGSSWKGSRSSLVDRRRTAGPLYRRFPCLRSTACLVTSGCWPPRTSSTRFEYFQTRSACLIHCRHIYQWKTSMFGLLDQITRIDSTHTCRMSPRTLKTAVSVEWCARYTDRSFGSSLNAVT